MKIYKEYYNSARKDIEKSIFDFSINGRKTVAGISEKIVPIVDPFFDINESEMGKRLRAVMVILAYEAFGGQNRKAIANASIAIELFQTGILGHDDIIDRSPKRRGLDALHVALARQQEKKEDKHHYGLSQAICVGDLGMFWGLDSILNGDFPANAVLESARIFTRMAINTIGGEILDVHLPYSSEQADEEDYLSIIANKTSWYTFIGPLQMGAALAGAGKNQMQELEEIGLELGNAYQMRDDFLGVFGDEGDTGKSNTSDISENKITLLTISLWKILPKSEKNKVKNIFGKKDISYDELIYIRDIINSYGIAEKTRNRISVHFENAKKLIKESSIQKEYAEMLIGMCNHLEAF